MVLCEDTKVADLTAEHFSKLTDENGFYYDENKVLVIHSDIPDKELYKARKDLDRIDIDDDPLRVVISVLMLREGFDKNNICVTGGFKGYRSRFTPRTDSWQGIEVNVSRI